jgi:hypothetical protein
LHAAIAFCGAESGGNLLCGVDNHLWQRQRLATRCPGRGALMPRTPARFSQADIARALRAADASGTLRSVEIARDGTIRIVPYEPGDKRPPYVPKSLDDYSL